MYQKSECEDLMKMLLPFAEDQLKKFGEFYPFGAVLLKDGTIEKTATYDGNEFPQSAEVIQSLIQVHKALAYQGKIKASGIVWNASVKDANGKKTDSIIISLEHKDNYSVIVGEPYKIGLFKKVKFGDLYALEGNHNVF